MIQYFTMVEKIIKDKDNNPIRVRGFRKRQKYALDSVYYKDITDNEVLRPDVLSERLFGSVFKIGAIIDSNEKDVLSFKKGDKIKYPNKDLIV